MRPSPNKHTYCWGRKELYIFLMSWLECQSICTCKFSPLEHSCFRRYRSYKSQILSVESDQNVRKCPYDLKLLNEMEGKYKVIGTGCKALPVGGYVLHDSHLQVHHIEPQFVFLNEKGSCNISFWTRILREIRLWIQFYRKCITVRDKRICCFYAGNDAITWIPLILCRVLL